MKSILRLFKTFLVTAVLLLPGSVFITAEAQDFADGGAYITYISGNYKGIMEDYMSYASAVAHGKSARKVDSRRQELMKSVGEAIRKVSVMGPYKGDKSLRDSTVSFLRLTHIVLNEDYGKIMNMEEIAEQSYDAMEAYLLAQDKADEKLKKAGESLKETEKGFADRNKVTLVEASGKDELGAKVREASKVNDYHRRVYLIFFKSYKQEVYLMDAVEKKNINGIEQNKNTLVKYSEEGLAKLDTMKAYNGDKSLVEACRQVLLFHKSECKEKLPSITNFFIKDEDFKKIKKAFDAKKQTDRTQADVDQYNKAIGELNAGVEEYNKTNNELFLKRKTVIESWNKTSASFLDKHVPKYK